MLENSFENLKYNCVINIIKLHYIHNNIILFIATKYLI